MEFVLMRSWAFSGGVTVPVEGNCRDSSFGVLASQTPLWLTLPLHLSLLIIHPMSLFVLSRLTNMLVVQISMFVNRRLDSRFPRICLSWHNPWCVFFFCLLFKPVDTDFYGAEGSWFDCLPPSLFPTVPPFPYIITCRPCVISPVNQHMQAHCLKYIFFLLFFCINICLQLNRLLTWVHLTPP